MTGCSTRREGAAIRASRRVLPFGQNDGNCWGGSCQSKRRFRATPGRPHGVAPTNAGQVATMSGQTLEPALSAVEWVCPYTSAAAPGDPHGQRLALASQARCAFGRPDRAISARDRFLPGHKVRGYGMMGFGGRRYPPAMQLMAAYRTRRPPLVTPLAGDPGSGAWRRS
jgi:hypothetical protein